MIADIFASNVVMQSVIIGFIILFVLSIILRKLLSSSNTDNTLTKRLINYLSNEKCSKREAFREDDYNTFDLDKRTYNNSKNCHKKDTKSATKTDNGDDTSKTRAENETGEDGHNHYNNNNQEYGFINTQNICLVSIPTLIKNQTDYDKNSPSFANNADDNEAQLREAKLSRFAIDYCRASPFIALKTQKNLNIGWRQTKYYFSVDFESIDYNGDERKETGIMNIYPIHKSSVNFDDELLKENFCKLILSLNSNENIVSCFHLDILKNHNLLVKIERFHPAGSLRDLIFGTNPLENFKKKYPQNKKGKALHNSLISLYSSEILSTLAYLHERKMYHLHLHSGNILIDEKNNKIKITGIENFICDFTIRNENYFNYLLENISHENNNSLRKHNSSDLFLEIFRNKFNVFEKYDLVSFGRILYEMVFGKELNSPYPDEIEFKSIHEEIAKIFKLIFYRKGTRNGFSNRCSVPDVTAKDLLQIPFFRLNNQKKKELLTKQTLIGNKIGENLLKEEDIENEESTELSIENSEFCTNLKQKIYDQNKFLQKKLKEISKII